MAKDKRLGILKQANKLFRQGKIEASIKEYTKVLDLKPDDLEVRRIVGDLQLRQNALPEAIKQFEWIADYYLKEGFFAKSIAMFKRITRIDPTYEKAAFKLAELYTKQGLVIEAKQIYLDLAEKYKRKKDQKKALDMYKKILEFDRSNIKMRLLLADNFYKEGLQDEAVNEYTTAADILLRKRDYSKAEEVLKNTITKVKSPKIVGKLVDCYSAQGNEDKAIETLRGMGSELLKNVELMKMLGEMYFKKGRLEEAEKVFAKVAQVDPGQAEVVMKLGKVYLEREEYDKTYQLLLPVVDKNLTDGKVEEAENLLRFIIASKFDYLPAKHKLASIFEQSGKTGNLIALYESLIPIYEKEGMRAELKENLEQLIKLSDTPITYQDQLQKLMDEKAEEDKQQQAAAAEAAAGEKEQETVKRNLGVAEDAIRISDFRKAIDVLKDTKLRFPQSIEVREKLFAVYNAIEEIDQAVEEGKDLLTIYEKKGLDFERSELLDKLSLLNPEDEKLIELSGEEKTNIDIDFGTGEFQEQMEEIKREEVPLDAPRKVETEEDVLLLTDMDGIGEPEPEPESQEEQKFQKSFSSLLSELDFYINDGYFGDAEQLVNRLKKQYSGNEELLKKIEKLERAKSAKEEPLDEPAGPGFAEPLGTDTGDKGFSDLDNIAFEMGAPEFEEDPGEQTAELHIDEVESKDRSEKFLEVHEAAFQLGPSITDEPEMAPEFGDTDSGSGFQLSDDAMSPPAAQPEQSDAGFEVEMEEPDDTGYVPLDEVDDRLAARAPEGTDFSVDDAFNLDGVMDGEAAPPAAVEPAAVSPPISEAVPADAALVESESPFQEIDQTITFEDEDDILKTDGLLLEDEIYFETEKNAAGEKAAVDFWLKELEKQRTTTLEKNMVEIFDEFKRGIDEKIGREDVDTRYNLGIAYKEMGLLEEAIHEFLITSKHPTKIFDSAGLLGMCFMEKGMLSEAAGWYEKALETPDRSPEEYLAIKYDLMMVYRSKDDFNSAVRVIEEILSADPNYRNVGQLLQELRGRAAQ